MAKSDEWKWWAGAVLVAGGIGYLARLGGIRWGWGRPGLSWDTESEHSAVLEESGPDRGGEVNPEVPGAGDRGDQGRGGPIITVTPEGTRESTPAERAEAERGLN